MKSAVRAPFAARGPHVIENIRFHDTSRNGPAITAQTLGSMPVPWNTMTLTALWRRVSAD